MCLYILVWFYIIIIFWSVLKLSSSKTVTCCESVNAKKAWGLIPLIVSFLKANKKVLWSTKVYYCWPNVIKATLFVLDRFPPSLVLDRSLSGTSTSYNTFLSITFHFHLHWRHCWIRHKSRGGIPHNAQKLYF